MSGPLRWLALVGGLTALPAYAQATRRPSSEQAPPADARSPALGPEDEEVVQNLELLEHLPESRDLDTMLELAQVQASDGEEHDP